MSKDSTREELRQQIIDEMNSRRIDHKTYIDSDWLLSEYDKSFHQELQKAREKERERIIYITKNIKDAFMSPLTERRWLQCIQFKDQPKPKDQSELDQPTV